VRTLAGHAAVFNSDSEPMYGFIGADPAWLFHARDQGGRRACALQPRRELRPRPQQGEDAPLGGGRSRVSPSKWISPTPRAARDVVDAHRARRRLRLQLQLPDGQGRVGVLADQRHDSAAHARSTSSSSTSVQWFGQPILRPMSSARSIEDIAAEGKKHSRCAQEARRLDARPAAGSSSSRRQKLMCA
jgi:hypothetical protein